MRSRCATKDQRQGCALAVSTPPVVSGRRMSGKVKNVMRPDAPGSSQAAKVPTGTRRHHRLQEVRTTAR